MFGPIIRGPLITALLCLSFAENSGHNNVQSVPNELAQIREAVRSALPSDWKVLDAKADELFPWPANLRGRYKGYVVEIVGPNHKIETTDKGHAKTQTVTVSKTAKLYFILVWKEINPIQLLKDWKEGENYRASAWGAQGDPDWVDRIAYGWNTKYFLVCEHNCEVVGRVAKMFKIPKRQYQFSSLR
jgi:hypothetical protein